VCRGGVGGRGVKNGRGDRGGEGGGGGEVAIEAGIGWGGV